MTCSMPWRRLFRLAILLSGACRIGAICYYPDGTSISPQDVPCSDDGGDSTCCGPGYACLSNKICMATSATANDEHGNPPSKYVRGSCTDKTWRSSACPAFCLNPNKPNQDLISGGEGMAKCPNTSDDVYYCVDFNQHAVDCSNNQNVLRFPGQTKFS